MASLLNRIKSKGTVEQWKETWNMSHTLLVVGFIHFAALFAGKKINRLLSLFAWVVRVLGYYGVRDKTKHKYAFSTHVLSNLTDRRYQNEIKNKNKNKTKIFKDFSSNASLIFLIVKNIFWTFYFFN